MFYLFPFVPVLSSLFWSQNRSHVRTRLMSGQVIEHYKPSILQRIQCSAILPFSRDIQTHSFVTLVRDPWLSSAAMGLEEIQ